VTSTCMPSLEICIEHLTVESIKSDDNLLLENLAFVEVRGRIGPLMVACWGRGPNQNRTFTHS